MKIINDVLQPREIPLVITGLHTEVKVLCKYPKGSVILCCIDGYTPLTYFPLVWTGQYEDDYLVFKGKLLFDKEMIDHINKDLDNAYLSFKIYSTPVKGKQKFTINYASINRIINSLPNTYLQLVNTVNELSVKLDEYITNQITNKQFTTTVPVSPGMVPTATDTNGNYVWDYPYMQERQIVADSVKVLSDVSAQIKILTERVNSLEEKILKHIYVEYE